MSVARRTASDALGRAAGMLDAAPHFVGRAAYYRMDEVPGPNEISESKADADTSHFFAYLYRLRLIERWSLMRNTLRESAAEHSFHVALLTHALCTISREVFGKQIDTHRAVTLALFHDVTEVITGDIPTPVKHHNPAMLSAMREIESLAADRLLGMVPAALRETYAPLIRPEAATRDDAAALQLVKAADKLDAYLKCVTELAAGNREFAVAKRQIEAPLRLSPIPEVQYFLERFTPSFEKTLDEISE